MLAAGGGQGARALVAPQGGYLQANTAQSTGGALAAGCLAGNAVLAQARAADGGEAEPDQYRLNR